MMDEDRRKRAGDGRRRAEDLRQQAAEHGPSWGGYSLALEMASDLEAEAETLSGGGDLEAEAG